MPTQPVSDAGHADEYQGEEHVIACLRGVQQHGIGRFVHDEAPRRDAQKPPCGAARGAAMAAKTQQMMTTKRHPHSRQPAEYIGHQRVPVSLCDKQGGSAPVHRGGHAAHDDEPADATSLSPRG